MKFRPVSNRAVAFSAIDYMLVQYDTVNYARKNDILVGCGRGSAGGCLVLYLLGIQARKFHNPVVCDIYLPCLLERVSEILLPAIQEDTVNYARKNDILVGCGRGSAGGCLVLYLLGITLIDT